MAKEVAINMGLQAQKGGVVILQNIFFNITMAGDDIQNGTQLIGTAAEAINLGEITGTPGVIMIQNIDLTNYVDISLIATGATPFCRLLAGQTCLFSPGAATIYAIANTAAVRVFVTAIEA